MSDHEEIWQAPLRYFQASKLGNGVGLTVLQREIPEGENCRTLTIHVLPKLWRRKGTYDRVFTLPEGISTETFHTFVYEMDVVALDESWAAHFSKVAPAQLQEQSADEEEEGATDPLWSETRSRPNTEPLGVLNTGHANTLWELINTYGMSPVPLADKIDLPPSCVSILPDVPELKIQFYRQFLRHAEEAVRQRKPVFLQTQDELNFVRGRMVPQGLIKRKIYHRVPVLCEFDSLTADNHIWQVIRAAVQVAGQVEDQYLQAYSVEIDAHLRDVGIRTSAELLGERLSSTELSRIGSHLRKAYLLARSILAKQLGVGFEEPTYAGGVIANLKVVSSDLWEKIVADYLRQSIPQAEVEEQADLHLYYKADGAAAKAKRPDIVLKHGHSTTVYDAKYKFRQKHIGEASMVDQYQLATYAYRLASDAFLVYPHKPGQEPLQSEFYLPKPGSSPNGKLGSDALSHRIGVLSLPFPSPGAADFSLAEVYRERIREIFRGS
ncbi:MAG: hypothetical protein Q4A03_10375 [Rothia sp. (in: high G+C Gram-positive bacteria)]|uniref:5-methylcytosine restriction system specificity protein McrC n=1 Tax=Rothia sp. (in: high G+C Gram-positive bacteria) TaxID=1885016 RepID=UPI0026F791A7|nr:hypothetical protein [Rothia sp. (in: high G+C Gram-positive bacteria)]